MSGRRGAPPRRPAFCTFLDCSAFVPYPRALGINFPYCATCKRAAKRADDIEVITNYVVKEFLV